MKKHILTISILLTTIFSLDFNEGPYGSNYFDIAGPFTLVDMNLELGDVTGDDLINILDIISTVNYILGSDDFTADQIIQADMNFDGEINILDLIGLANLILTPQPGSWDFATQWNGEDTYIFITVGPASSTALWNASDSDDLLSNSPDNVHYFFLSNRTTYFTDVRDQKGTFDLLLNDLSEEEQAHWKSHLHFIPNKCDSHDESFVDAVCGVRAVGIDRLQRWKEVGYLGNPANFSGTYMAYLAHEAVYYNYEFEALHGDSGDYDEITIFDREYYTGGWAASIYKSVELPSNENLSDYKGLSVELLRGCPDSDMNYSDAGCDDYDRKAYLYSCESDSSGCKEIARWITPFDRQPHSLTDISPFISHLRPGGSKVFRFQEDGWPNSLLTVRFRFHKYLPEEEYDFSPMEYIDAWNGTVQFNPQYADNRPPVIFTPPEGAQRVELVAYITGHGWGSAGCYNCAEFCNSRHNFSINGGTYEFNKSHPEAGDNNYCMELETIAQGVVPNQFGTWGYGRAGWCPGMDVTPYITDITDYINVGEENILLYDACRVVGNNCVTPPTCQGDGYCPEIAMSSYLIYYY